MRLDWRVTSPGRIARAVPYGSRTRLRLRHFIGLQVSDALLDHTVTKWSARSISIRDAFLHS